MQFITGLRRYPFFKMDRETRFPQPKCAGRKALKYPIAFKCLRKIDGTCGDDRITGTDADEIVYAGAGDDVVHGSDGYDVIYGGEGEDELRGGNGRDFLTGGSGDDLLIGGTGSDWMEGNEGNDMLRGSNGNDTMDGNDGDDNLLGGFGNDRIDAGKGTDVTDAGQGNDSIVDDNTDKVPWEYYPGSYNYYLRGNSTIIVGEGNDEIEAFASYIDVKGGDGDDFFSGGGNVYRTPYPILRYNYVDGNIHMGDGDDRVNSEFTRGFRVVAGDGNDHYYAWETSEGKAYMGNGNDRAVFFDLPEFYGSESKTRKLYLGNGDDYVALANVLYSFVDGEISAGGGDDTLKLQFQGNVDGGPGDDYFYIPPDRNFGGFDFKFPRNLLGGTGDDYLYSSFQWDERFHNVTLGSGNDVIKVRDEDSPSRCISPDLRFDCSALACCLVPRFLSALALWTCLVIMGKNDP
mmetsp:Transcript_4335/g.18455  ORF Transcript_4335/g.18455 Transcript_4335/m.18455 type:complete len:461 (-) Transcript_4335:323-1705(-)